MKKYKYLIFATIISPFLGVFLVTYLDLSILTLTHGVKFEAIQFMLSSAATALLGCMVSLPSVLLLGIPVYFLLKKIKLSTSWMYCIIGYLGGVVGYFIFLYKGEYNLEIQLNGINMFGLYGLSVSLIFWYLSVHLARRSQKRTNKSSNLTGANDAPSS